MKTYRKTLILMIAVSILSLFIGGLIEFNKIGGEHYGFYVNISLGIFADAFLTLITSTSYCSFKNLKISN